MMKISSCVFQWGFFVEFTPCKLTVAVQIIVRIFDLKEIELFCGSFTQSNTCIFFTHFLTLS